MLRGVITVLLMFAASACVTAPDPHAPAAPTTAGSSVDSGPSLPLSVPDAYFADQEGPPPADDAGAKDTGKGSDVCKDPLGIDC